MKQERFIYGLVLLLALWACGEHKDAEQVYTPMHESSLSILVDIKGGGCSNSKTRTNSENVRPAIRSLSVEIYSTSGKIIANKQVKWIDSADEHLITFSNLLLGGGEKVCIMANPHEKHESLTHIPIEDIQPDKNSSVEESMYRIPYYGVGKTKMQAYGEFSANVELVPIASRVEIVGNINYDEAIVHTLKVDVITPSNYTKEFGKSDKYTPCTENKGPLWIDLEGDDYEKMKKGEYMPVFHFFPGDEQRIHIHIEAEIYQIQEFDENDLPIQNEYPKFDNMKSYVYKPTLINKESIPKDIFEFLKTLELKEMYYDISQKEKPKVLLFKQGEQEFYITDVHDLFQYFKIATRLSEDKGDVGFFGLISFKNNENQLIDDGCYKANTIYHIDLSKIDWNGDGIINEEDKYNPYIHGYGQSGKLENVNLNYELILGLDDWESGDVELN